MTTASVALRAAIHDALLADGALTSRLAAAKSTTSRRVMRDFRMSRWAKRLTDASSDGGLTQEHQLTLHAWSRRAIARAHVIVRRCRRWTTPLSPEGHRLVNLHFAIADIRRESDGRTYHALVLLAPITEPLI